jgi:hypothetical protein
MTMAETVTKVAQAPNQAHLGPISSSGPHTTDPTSTAISRGWHQRREQSGHQHLGSQGRVDRRFSQSRDPERHILRVANTASDKGYSAWVRGGSHHEWDNIHFEEGEQAAIEDTKGSAYKMSPIEFLKGGRTSRGGLRPDDGTIIKTTETVITTHAEDEAEESGSDTLGAKEHAAPSETESTKGLTNDGA